MSNTFLACSHLMPFQWIIQSGDKGDSTLGIILDILSFFNALSGIWAKGYVFPCFFFLSSSPSQRLGAIVGE
jgi:hypothetical protein